MFCFFFFSGFCQEGGVIKVQFIYGSKPLKKYRDTERKWFGGLPGGHVGIETDTNRFLSFEKVGRCHLYGHRKNRHSTYKLAGPEEFWDIMGTSGDSVRKATIIIPITALQRKILDSLSAAYIYQTPYDYAILGMRCAAATYDVLAHIGLVKKYTRSHTWMTILYPKRLRKRLLAQARKNGWVVLKQEGSDHRKWERDCKN